MKQNRNTGKPAVAVEISGNAKIGRTSATYVTQYSCPSDANSSRACALRHAGCYAEGSHVGMVTNQRNASPITDPDEIAQFEAGQINTLSGTLPLRLHVVGDCVTDQAALTVSGACSDYTERGNGKAWTYTHAFRDVTRESWQQVSVLASCETAADLTLAKSLGYATAIVFDSQVVGNDGKPFSMTDGGTEHRVIQCPNQTRGINCVDCPNLCRNDQNMIAHNFTIGFNVHGARKNQASAAIARMHAAHNN